MQRLALLLPLATALTLATVPACPAAAQEEGARSQWSRSEVASLRLIAGPTAASGKQRVGIEIVMAKGYKTYWRSPGDFGAPPLFDWSGSSNVGGLDVRWPVPERFPDGTGSSLGYVDEVVIPVSVQPVDPSKPVMVVLKLDFAACDKICVPVRGEANLWLEAGVTTVVSQRLSDFERRVPQPVRRGEVQHGRIGLSQARLRETAGGQVLQVMLKVPETGGIEDVFVEGPGPWRFGRPAIQREPGGEVLAQLQVLDRPKGNPGPAPFIITVRGVPGPVEARLDLDIADARP